MGRKTSKRRRRPEPEHDSLGLILRDLAIRAGLLGVAAGAVLWAAELPQARAVPGVAYLPRLSAIPALSWLPTAAEVFPSKARPRARAVTAAAGGGGGTPAPERHAPPKEAPIVQAMQRPSNGGVKLAVRGVLGVPVHVVTVDLHDPAVVGTLVLANGAQHPNTADDTHGDEAFEAMAARTRAAVSINGTFFSKDAQKRVMGNMVRNGQLIKFSQWDHDGTTFWLGEGNRPGMRTPSAEGAPPWNGSWLALSCGPRLLRDGKPWLQPAHEGFKDSHVLGAAGRSALGYDAAGAHLYLASFDGAVTLAKEAEVMRAIGCAQAMNLDGGASRSLALGSRVVVPAGRPLTNVLAFYDRAHPAPTALGGAFRKFRAKED